MTPSPKRSETINPTTGETLATYDEINGDQASAIVREVGEGFGLWRQRPVKERADIARRVGDLLRDRAGELAPLMTDEMGKLLSQAKQEIELCAAICDYTAENGSTQLADEHRSFDGGRAIVTYQPVGVVLGIQPFNFPIYQALRYSIPQLVAGNTVLLKHSHSVWGSALALEQLYHDAGVPSDAFRVLLCSNETATGLIADPAIRGVTLTGSTKAGSEIAAEAGRHIKKTVLELGSNDAYLVLSDADIDLAVTMCVNGRIYNNGETCVAAKRFIIADPIYDRFRAGFVDAMGALSVGDPRDESTDLGPMARDDLRATLHDQVTVSVDAGATLTIGGELPDGDGFFYPATVLEDVEPGMAAYDDELFGPVASLIRVSDDDMAIDTANDSRFGLGGGIFSANVDRAVELAIDRFDTGMVNINGYNLANPNLPFGGVKQSGYGREHGGFGIKEFVNAKSVLIAER